MIGPEVTRLASHWRQGHSIGLRGSHPPSITVTAASVDTIIKSHSPRVRVCVCVCAQVPSCTICAHVCVSPSPPCLTKSSRKNHTSACTGSESTLLKRHIEQKFTRILNSNPTRLNIYQTAFETHLETGGPFKQRFKTAHPPYSKQPGTNQIVRSVILPIQLLIGPSGHTACLAVSHKAPDTRRVSPLCF